MNLNTLFILILMFMAGLALGALYFISLWETVRRLERTGGRCASAGYQLCGAAGDYLNSVFLSDAWSLGEVGGGYDRICGDTQNPHISSWAAKGSESQFINRKCGWQVLINR